MAHFISWTSLIDHYGEQHPLVALFYENQGVFFHHKKAFQQAFYYLEKALSIRQDMLDPHHPDLIENYNLIALVYADQKKYDLALQLVQRAIILNTPGWKDANPYANPPLKNVISEVKLLNSLHYKAEVLAKRFDSSVQNRRDLEASLTVYQHAARLLDQMRGGYRTEGSKLILANNTHEIYDKALRAAVRLLRLKPNPTSQEACFQLLEKSRNAVLLEAMNEAKARQFAGIPDTLLNQERSLRSELAFLDKNILQEQLKGEAADSIRLNDWQNQSFDLQRTYERLLQQFETKYPDYHKLKYNTETADLKDVQEHILDENTAMIEYFVGKDSIFILSLSLYEFQVIPVAKDSTLKDWISDLREGVKQQDFQMYSDAAYKLYTILLLPVKKQIRVKNLLIIPDGVLNDLPFEALLTKKVESSPLVKDYRSFPYLIQQYSISYAYSATLLLETLNRNRSAPKRDFLAYAPVFAKGIKAETRNASFFTANQLVDSIRSSLPGALPSSRDEVLAIRRLFSSRYGLFEKWFGKRSAVFLEENADERSLKSWPLDQYRYLHFATHGFVNKNNPELSGLLLAQDKNREEDGVLHLGEIYNLQLNADLVTLSACETGLGKIAQGEGLIGLSRGFLYAGAQNLLVSLWQVNDLGGARLITDFYRRLLAENSKAAALREAKLAMIENDPVYAHPIYWAPFVLIGR